ncbi:TetR/AcrR family transcriptional regulator [Pedobacter cryoconitis]|uniref:AcrR family transcriptional regulator n=1 Tax=Pedobacter cryoconitis TaxID=188932 RepID=A0A7X0J1E7_9SPHI|nr:TetR/AcrR family transcriptional regulator [Pedobacter cryoconitis]MBB6499155.1 AcrR family transcriptional regulator [Pedobacter cryoconitis]
MLSKSDRTKQFIVEKSAPIFNTKGYAATSMTDILKATGLTKGGIYGNFNSKDDIAVEAFDYSYTKIKEALLYSIKQEKTATGKLISILEFYHNFTITPAVEGGCPVLNTAIDADDNIPFMKQRAAQALNEMLGSLTYIIQKGIDSAEFKLTINAAHEALLFYATIEGGIMMSKLTDKPDVLNNILKNLKEQIENRYKA